MGLTPSHTPLRVRRGTENEKSVPNPAYDVLFFSFALLVVTDLCNTSLCYVSLLLSLLDEKMFRA